MASVVFPPPPGWTYGVYFAFELVGSFVCMILFVTMNHSPSIVRHPTVKNLVGIGALTGWIQSMLLFRNYSIQENPNLTLCLVQGSFTLATETVHAAALFGVSSNAFLAVWSFYRGTRPYGEGRKVKAVLLALPWLLAILLFMTGLLTGLHDSKTIQRLEFRCSINSHNLTTLRIITSSVVGAADILLSVATLLMMMIRRSQFQQIAGRADVAFILRTFPLNLLLVVEMSLMFILFAPVSPSAHLFAELFCSTNQIVVFLVWASHADVINVWSSLPRIKSFTRAKAEKETLPTKSIKISFENFSNEIVYSDLPIGSVALTTRRNSFGTGEEKEKVHGI